MERKTSRQYSGVLLVKGEKFKVQNLLSRTSSLLCSAANSVSTSLEFAVFGSRPDAKHSEANAFCFFFCTQPWFLRRSEHIFPDENTLMLIDRAAIDKQLGKY